MPLYRLKPGKSHFVRDDDGKLVRMPEGGTVELNEKQANAFRDKFEKVGEAPAPMPATERSAKSLVQEIKASDDVARIEALAAEETEGQDRVSVANAAEARIEALETGG